ncbi:hypothetical protein CAPTEDRAFT_209016 [Capitella teleta]|uniref:Ig-like domain-containing protein n=1 Tax=Capitella teleta TaxID=283909 RepID=R7UZG9_CAPTE|nr:hypothetical protein CAPTEDRAFT_209016 [Capitella teleta]|eukprot:ELU11669.1 hypothetical protein CAPTEDRAFT_209016 [Capitella teleta]
MASWCVLLLTSVCVLRSGHAQDVERGQILLFVWEALNYICLLCSSSVVKLIPVQCIQNGVNPWRSRLESDASEAYVMHVRYAPGDASIDGDSAVVAGDGVTLTCSTKDHGNPQGIFKWKKPNGRIKTEKYLTIENLNVDEDDGDYECYVENDVAQGTSATHTLTVHSVPCVEQDLDSKKSVVNTDDVFSVSCAFRAKPAASVAWKREDDSALSSDIFSTSSNQQADGKLSYTLKGAIPADQKHGVTEGASVYFFVEALSHPTPDFQWKRTFNNKITVNLPSV